MADKFQEEMITLMKKLASSYVPELIFEEEHPGIGTALALVCGEMMSGVEKRYARIMEKKQIDFFNAIGADLTPAATAKGYVSFGLVNDTVPAVQVPAKTYVVAEAEQAESGMCTYETQDDLLVTPAKLTYLYEVDDKEDYIGNCTEGKTELDTYLFQHSARNQQEHILYIGQEEVLSVSGAAWFTISFERQAGMLCSEAIVRKLLESDIAEICYSSKEGFLPFEKQGMEQGKLLFYKGEGQPAFEKMQVNGEENVWIRIQLKQYEPIKELSYEKIKLTGKMQAKQPDLVIADGMEADLHRYYPFGERLSIYNEVYFASDEMLRKRGAEIELSFFLSFDSIPLNTGEEQDIQWKWVMKESDFQKPKEYEITIASVVWEYYNGIGWTRLYKDKTNEDVFTVCEGRYVKITFICPQDIEPAFLNSVQAYAIRARITKMNHPYQLNGRYVVPVIEYTAFTADYSKHPVEQVSIWCKNNQQWKQGMHKPFIQMNCDKPAFYLGFSIPPAGGPIKMYWQFREMVKRTDSSLMWEYWNGREFEVLHVIDETVNFSKSGLITFVGPGKMKKHSFFGQEGYWFRVTELEENRHLETGNTQAPFLKSITMNTVKVENLEMPQTEYFQMEYHVKQKKFRLQKQNIQTIHVYVKEPVIGSLEEEWVEWQRTEHFLDSTEQSKHYILNQNEGYIMFGDGAAGKIPSVSMQDNIKVVYQCGGGTAGNVTEEKINRLSQSIGFINSVRNKEPMSGGLDQETRAYAIKRCSSQVRLRNRAVTARDYESIAYAASRRIEKARCFAGKDDEGKAVFGAITLVLLLKDYQSGSAQFQGVRNTVMEYLKGKMPDTIYNAGKLFIIEPVFIIFQVKAEVVVKDFNQVFEVQRQVKEAVTSFFEPIQGNFDKLGWETGTLPNMIQIRNIIHLVNGVEEIKSLFVTAYQNGTSGLEEVELERVKNCPYVLPVSGEHQISVDAG